MAKFTFTNMLQVLQAKEEAKQKKIEWLEDEFLPKLSGDIPKSTAALMVEHKKAIEQAMFWGHSTAPHKPYGYAPGEQWALHPPAYSASAWNYTQIDKSYAPTMTREQAIALNNGD